jgi:MYXO-CTERM domain-containing protein
VVVAKDTPIDAGPTVDGGPTHDGGGVSDGASIDGAADDGGVGATSNDLSDAKGGCDLGAPRNEKRGWKGAAAGLLLLGALGVGRRRRKRI